MRALVEYPGHDLHKRRVEVVDPAWDAGPGIGVLVLVRSEHGIEIGLAPEHVRILAESAAA